VTRNSRDSIAYRLHAATAKPVAGLPRAVRGLTGVAD